jgi:ketosteroid isomerase-like protein
MTAENKASDEVEIRALIDDWTAALHAKDVNKLMASYASNVVSFDRRNPAATQRPGCGHKTSRGMDLFVAGAD